jgi:hypothetical protein
LQGVDLEKEMKVEGKSKRAIFDGEGLFPDPSTFSSMSAEERKAKTAEIKRRLQDTPLRGLRNG